MNMSNIYFDQGSNRNSCSKKKSVDKILDNAISGHDVTADECIQLFETEGQAATRVFEVANFLRSQVNGNKVSNPTIPNGAFSTGNSLDLLS